jgi:hypothetical protein
MHRCQQVASADWLVHSKTPWPQLATFGPSGFEAYARLRFIPDPEFVGQRENDVSIPIDHPSNIELARRALLHLASFTDTADECYFCLWTGYTQPGADPANEYGPWWRFRTGDTCCSLDRWTTSLTGNRHSPLRQQSPPRSCGQRTGAGASPAMSTPTGPESGRNARR